MNDPLLTTTLTAMVISLIVMAIIPILPGQLLVWVAAVVYGLLAGWDQLGWPLFFFLTFAMILAMVLDEASGWYFARKSGASFGGIGMGCLVGFIALLVFNALGALLGMLGGLIGYEYWRQKDWQLAFKAGGGYLLGLLVAFIIRFSITLGMVAVFWQATA